MSISEKIRTSFLPLPVLEGIIPVTWSQIPMEIIAGISLAALAIPEVMGYANIAGMPVVTGLYTILIPLVVFAIFGSSRHLVVGADSATAAILSTTLISMAMPGSSEYVNLASMVALLAAGFLFLSRIFRLGFIADFLSRSVLIGFLTGVGIQVALGQIPGMIGVSGGNSSSIIQLINLISAPQLSLNSITLLLSGAVLAIIICGNTFAKRIPWPFLVVIGGIVVSWGLNLSASGVAMIGEISYGFPGIGFPIVPPDQIPTLIGTSAACFVVILTQSAATSRAYAARYGESFDENVDLVGLALSNVAAGLSGTFVVNGSPTKTEMVDSAGGKTQIAQLVTFGVVCVALLFFTRPLSFLPSAVLATIVFVIGIHLIDVRGMKNLYSRRPVEFVVALFTALTVLCVSVGWGIAVAIVLSMIAHLRHSYRPLNFLLIESPNRGWALRSIDSGSQASPGLVVYQFGANLYYANEARFTSEILGIVQTANPPLQWLCLSAVSIQDIDFSGSEAIRQLHGELKNRGIVLVMSSVEDPVMKQLERDRLIDLIGRDHFFEFNRDVVIAYNEHRDS
ncbi:SulP family inorganic anion transporter [Methanospirillum lacunae]|uniref:Sodium-independent anion transporter n=1 Tax=Methanospirillum lacunae TaxID=668570 RepID=A0A2V2NBM0_9EURY|nr:SulP family inorganic anion transporter [Methanospirillum lacunae]PWR73868.1 sodium-independent anion transporter [Methanospirillum lacunae]